MNRIIIVQGGQWGSEAKGAIAGYIGKNESVDVAVRTGATNAGHTVYYKREPRETDSYDAQIYFDGCDAKPVKMQQLPVGWVNPDTELVLGAGALIDPTILARECKEVSRLTGKDIRRRLYIDYRAGVHLPTHQERSKSSGRHYAIGATGKGCSEALIDKIRGRGQGYKTFGNISAASDYQVVDTCDKLNKLYDSGAKILLEGTQGQLLDLHLGPYPYTTHKQTGPAVWLAECGLSPALPLDIVMVVRTYPIRVAGNSGPMPNETTWPELARKINHKRKKSGLLGLSPIVKEEAVAAFDEALAKVVLEPFESTYALLSEANKRALERLPPETVNELTKLFEMTTVTKKLRRVARMSWRTLHESATQIRPHRVALTFMNYEFPEYWYKAPISQDLLPDDALDYLRLVTDTCRAPISHITFGPADSHVLKCC